GLRYASDTRGDAPFRPRVTGGPLKTIQVPTTMPTMDELLGRVRDLSGTLIDALRPGVNVLTLHAEVEGGPLGPAIESFVERARGAGGVREARSARRGHRAAGRAGRCAHPHRACRAPADDRLRPVRDPRRDARGRRADRDVRSGRASLRVHEGGDRAELSAVGRARGLALARRGGVEPGDDRHARGPGTGLVAGRERHSDGEPPAVRLAVLGLVVVSLVLAGCGAFRHRPTTAEASRSPAGEAGRSAAPAAPAAPAGPPAPTGP